MLAIAWHSRTGASKMLALAACDGAREAAPELRVEPKRAEEVEPEWLLAASAYLFACPENLATMSGVMKDMFDRCYYPLLGRVEGRPYASLVAAGSDGQGAQAQLDRIVTGWRLRRVAEPVIVHTHAQTAAEILATKVLAEPEILRARELGQKVALGLSMGIF